MRDPVTIGDVFFAFGFGFLVGILLTTTGCTPKPQSTEPVRTNKVSMIEMRFEPKVIKVPAGVPVTWTNNSMAYHNVVIGNVKSVHLSDGQTFTHVFPDKGTFDYYCEPHRGMGMVGTVIVE